MLPWDILGLGALIEETKHGGMWQWILFCKFNLLSSSQSRSRLGYVGQTNISSGQLAKALAVLGLSIQPARLHTSYEARTICGPQQERGGGKRRGRGQPAIFSMEGRKAKSILLKNSTELNWPRQENHSRRWDRLVVRRQAVSLQCRRF